VPGLLEQSRWKSKQYHIYALVDPRDNLVRYIGITTDTKHRYRQHSRRAYNRSIWRWARELEHLGTPPVMRFVETINREAGTSDNTFRQIVSEREAHWIDELSSTCYNKHSNKERYWTYTSP
jgi:predicted GIY-YIG superfamily endonuclease